MAAFLGWLKDRGGYINPKLDLFHQTGSGDRGVFATQDVSEGEQLILVPVPSTLHLDVEDITDKASKVPATCSKAIAAFLQQQQPPFSSFLGTTLMLMAELSAGADSAFAAYFETLPDATDCLLNWSEEEKQLLAGTSLETEGRRIEDIYAADIAPKLAAAPDLFPNASYDAFRRAADMVQTRAFHMKADNWITGASQEATDELYLIPAIDMLNHATYPALRNTSLALVSSEVEVTLGDGQKKHFKDFFSMKAEKDIPAGTQVLHTYGDLSDAQLLQTYGFLDAPPPAAAAAAGGKQKSKSKAAAAAAAGKGGNPHNYVVVPVSVLLDAVRVVAAAAHLWPAKKAKQLMKSKVAFLASVGLLQQEAPLNSQLLVSATRPLPDGLLTIVQVLLMTEEEFQQLQQAEQEQQQQETAEQQQQQQKTLDLGHDLLQGEFGELVGTVLLQVAATCLKRYPIDAAATATVMAAADTGSRTWMAAAVGLGEQQLLLQLKKAALQVMVEANQAADEDEDELDSELDSEDEDDSELDSDEAEPPTKKSKKATEAAAAAAAANKRSKKQTSTKAAAAAAAADDKQQQQQQEGGQKHKHHHSKKDKHSHQHKQHTHSSKGKQDNRPHYGAMTGPAEEEIWQSDDSDKVGYSSDEEKGERHPADPSEHHTYEVGAAGAVREVHGHMVGPDEADLIESDDSDKVGYGDDGSDGAAAAASRSGSRKRSRGGSSSRSKKPKKGLGFKA